MSTLFRNPKCSSSSAEVERLIAKYILDDSNPILSTLDMNRLASYTYGEVVREELFERLESLMKRPDNVSILALQKSLCLVQHLIIYGSEPCVNLAWNMSRVIEELQRYNPIPAPTLISQIIGGQVDRAFVVRELATELRTLLSNTNQITLLRHQHHATSSSLVPVGSTSQVGFAPTPTTAHQWQQQQQLSSRNQNKSNVAKPDSSFGGGTANKVISAAYSLEDMLQKAQEEEAKKRNRYFDSVEQEQKWHQQLSQQYATVTTANTSTTSQDLLDSFTSYNSNQKEEDLLGFPSIMTPQPAGPSSSSTSAELFMEQDLLLLGTTNNSAPSTSDNTIYTTPNPVEDLLSLPSTALIPPTTLDNAASPMVTNPFQVNSKVSSDVMGARNSSKTAYLLSSMEGLSTINTIPYNTNIQDFGVAPSPPFDPPSLAPSIVPPPPPPFAPPPPPPLDPTEPLKGIESSSSSLSTVQQLYLDQQQQLVRMQQQLINNGGGSDDSTTRQLMAMIQKQQEQLTHMVTMATTNMTDGAAFTSNSPPSTNFNPMDIMGGSSNISYPAKNL